MLQRRISAFPEKGFEEIFANVFANFAELIWFRTRHCRKLITGKVLFELSFVGGVGGRILDARLSGTAKLLGLFIDRQRQIFL